MKTFLRSALLAGLLPFFAMCATTQPAFGTVGPVTPVISYTGNGATTSFVVPFNFQHASDLVVSKTVTGTTTILVLGTDYSVQGVGSSYGGAVAMVVAPIAGSTLKIIRLVAETQPFSFRSQSYYNPALHEQAFDWLEYQVQQITAAQADGGTFGGVATSLAPGALLDDSPITGDGSSGSHLGFNYGTTNRWSGLNNFTQSVSMDAGLSATGIAGIDGGVVAWGGSTTAGVVARGGLSADGIDSFGGLGGGAGVVGTAGATSSASGAAGVVGKGSNADFFLFNSAGPGVIGNGGSAAPTVSAAGAGVVGNGGFDDAGAGAPGVLGKGSFTGPGVSGIGGPDGGAGGKFTGGADGGAGVYGKGGASGTGGAFTGGVGPGGGSGPGDGVDGTGGAAASGWPGGLGAFFRGGDDDGLDGAGVGVFGLGGTSIGGGGANGGSFTGTDSEAGLVGLGGPKTGAGGKFTGGQSGSGVVGNGGADGGSGGYFTGGSDGGIGVVGNGSGAGAGGKFTAVGNSGLIATAGAGSDGMQGYGGTSSGTGGQFAPGSRTTPVDGDIRLYVLSGIPSAPTDGALWDENLSSTAASSRLVMRMNATNYIIGGQPSFSGYVTTGQSVITATTTTFKPDTVIRDTDSAFNVSAGQFVVPANKGGDYLIVAQIAWSASTTGTSVLNVVNADLSTTLCTVQFPALAGSQQLTASCVANVAAGQAIKATMVQGSGSNKTILNGQGVSFLQIRRMGD
jgi:hypothetical protein